MKIWVRRTLFGLTALLLVLTGLVLFGYFAARKSLPQTEGQLSLRGLSAPVTVYRDEFAVPHIDASGETDLMRATGYVQAQDRLWQMDLLRRIAEGRLSERFGTKTLSVDKALRTIGFMRMATMLKDSLPPDVMALLQAYADGVNAFIEENKGNYPPEFTLIDFTPEAWKPEHSIALSRLLGWQLSMGWHVDVTYDRILDTVGFAKLQEILPRFPADAPTIVPMVPPDYNAKSVLNGISENTYHEEHFRPAPKAAAAELRHFAEALYEVKRIIGIEGFSVGSNNWVVSGARSVSGKPLLANDPHLGHAMPPTWYEMHLRGGRLDVAGFTLPGVPLIVLGNNNRIAWGFTNVMMDDADFYREQIRDSMYYFNGAWRKLDWAEEKIVIYDSTDVVFRIPMTHRGPIVQGFYANVSGSEAISVRWSGYEATREVEAMLGMNIAQDWTGFRKAASEFKIPAQNIVYADVDGHIAYQCVGNIPLRRNGNGISILDGSVLQNDWAGYLPFESNPYRLDPPEGFIASANNKTAGDWFPYFISNYWEHPSRIKRIHDFMNGQEKFSPADFQKFQNDFYSYHALEVIPYILEACSKDSNFTKQDLEHVSNYRYNESYLFLKHWDGRMHADSRGAAIFNVFFRRLTRNLYSDEMGDDLYRDFVKLTNIPTRVTTQLLQLPKSAWWDNVRTRDIEDRDAILRITMTETVDELTADLGSEPGGWAWGKIHHVEFEHFVGRQKPLNYLFNVGPFAVGGNTTTINNTEFNYSDSTYKAVIGASMRRIVDLADIQHPKTVLTVGQSGQPFSLHYDDQVRMWLDGQYKIINLDWGALRNNPSHHRLILTPPNAK